MFFYFTLGLSITIGACYGAAAPKVPSTTAPTKEIADVYYPNQEWSDEFDWQLLKVFSTNTPANIIISPLSLKIVLALLYEGSSGTTEKEFQNILKFPADKQIMREKFQKILESLQQSESKEYVLNLATKIFMDSPIKAQQKFASKASHNYYTDILNIPFENETDSANIINMWAKEVTHGRISQLIEQGDLKSAIMVIMNAVFFKGTWRHQFPKNQTRFGGFYATPTQVLNVPFMSTTDKFYFYESNELDAKILRLPYKGNKFAMFIVLPNSKGGLNELIRKVNLQSLKKQLYALDEVLVDVTIPKFKFDFHSRYANILSSFGLRQMFQNTASFPGIARGENNILRMLFVNDIIQKAGIELDEEGSTVYAATDVQIGNKFGDVENKFNATQPFLFFIEEQDSGTLLFLGKVENPLETESSPIPTRLGETQDLPAPLEAIIPNPSMSKIPNKVNNITPQEDESRAPDLQPPNPELEAIITRFNYFDLELLQEFSESSENVFVSPANIKTTLAMILEGAKGKCAQEINNALRISDINEVEIRDQLRRLLFDLNDRSPNTRLEAVNSVFISNKFKVLNHYQQKVAEYYRATIHPIDFESPGAVKYINNLASNATHGLIKQVVTEDNLIDATVLISNALYFKSKWKTAFDPKKTSARCFYSNTNQCIKTPTMEVGDVFNYNFVSYLNAHAIELPYQDDKYSMLLLIPSEKNSVKILARDMQHVHFSNILDSLRPTDLFLEMPKFSIEYSANLVEYLKPLKIAEIFGAKANLSGIVSDANVRINDIIHKTRLDVDESGTKAAATTSALVIPLMGSSDLRISADRPFIIFIYQKESRNIIFEGILVKPKYIPDEKPENRATKTHQSSRFANGNFRF